MAQTMPQAVGRGSNRRSEAAMGPAATAGRLRLLQGELADEPPETRQQLLADELERILRGVAPAERAGFLADLEELFPTWDGRVNVAVQSAAAPSRSQTDARELQDPSFLVARLIDVASDLSERDRDTVIERLREASLAPMNQSAWPSDAAGPLRDQLKMGGKAGPPPPLRVLELATMLARFANGVDPVIWLTWKEIAPRSSRRRQGDLASKMGRFASGDASVSQNEVQQDLESLRKMIAALIQAIAQARRQFAQSFRKYSPAEIEAFARLDKGRFEALETACWRKYKELSVDLEQDAIETALMQAIARYAEEILGPTR